MPFTTFSYGNLLGRQLSMNFSHFCTSSEQRLRPLFWTIILRLLVYQTASRDRQFLPLEQRAVLFFVLCFVSGFQDNSVGKESTCSAGNPDFWVWKTHWRRDRLPIPVFLGFPGGSTGKESACNMGDLGSILGMGRSPGEGKGYPLQYSGLENSMDYTVRAGHD